MSKISDLIFRGADHYITSKYGPRNTINTAAGATGSFHYGVDYGTNNKKLPQYAIENGVILSCGKDTAANGYAKYVWVSYPRIGKKFLHYHLDSISVVAGQTVTKGNLLGYTGMSGKATGIHLHLGVKDLNTQLYEDPEALKYEEDYIYKYLPKRGYFQKGDNGPTVGKIAAFLRAKYPQSTNKNALGNIYGPYLEKAVKAFQEKHNLGADGYTGPITLRALVDDGLNLFI